MVYGDEVCQFLLFFFLQRELFITLTRVTQSANEKIDLENLRNHSKKKKSVIYTIFIYNIVNTFHSICYFEPFAHSAPHLLPVLNLDFKLI